MKDMTVTGLVTLFPSTQREQDVFVGKLIDSVLSGCISPLDVEVQMAGIERAVKKYRCDERFKEALFFETERYSRQLDGVELPF